MANLTGNVGRWMFERNGNAVAAVLLGTAGLLLYGVILGPIAIGLGLLAKSQIRQSRQPGNATATLAIAIGIVAFAIPVVRLVG